MPEKLRLAETFRYPRYSRASLAIIDQETVGPACLHRNFYFVTSATYRREEPARLEHGIFTMAQATGPDLMSRRPAILIRSSPAKAGSFDTPWHDAIDALKGTAVYFGDKKAQDRFDRAEQSPGNKRLLMEAELHLSAERVDRLRAAPLVFFTSRSIEGMQKGHVRLEGVGVIARVELVSQLDPGGVPFPNYRFECTLISLAAEGETLDWRWIDSRRRIDTSLRDTFSLAPRAWQAWVDEGASSIPRVRRRLSLAVTMSPSDQMPVAGSPEDMTLSEVLAYYEHRKHRFEALAAVIIRERMTGGTYVPGWLSPPSGDGGWDIIGRLDVGDAARAVPLIVLG